MTGAELFYLGFNPCSDGSTDLVPVVDLNIVMRPIVFQSLF